MTIVFYN